MHTRRLEKRPACMMRVESPNNLEGMSQPEITSNLKSSFTESS
jgi:hypothetical protein